MRQNKMTLGEFLSERDFKRLLKDTISMPLIPVHFLEIFKGEN